MIHEYKKEFSIAYSTVDRTGNLGLVELMNLNQDTITEFCGSLKSDNKTLRDKFNAAWIYTRIKAKIKALPFWNTKVHTKTFICSKSPVRMEVETNVYDSENNLLAALKTEMCVIDFNARKICPLAHIDFPKEIETSPSNITEPFAKFKTEFEENDCVYSQKIFASDTDFTNHTNNVRYVKYIMNTFDSDFYDTKKITDFEIIFSKESVAGDNLKIFKKESAAGEFCFEILKDTDVNARAVLKYSE